MLKKENGNSLVILSAAMVVLFSAAALVVDLGLGFFEKTRLQNAADAAALAGAQDLSVDTDKAVQTARWYISKNGYDPDSADIQISEDGSSIRVTLEKKINYTFARIIGFTEQVATVHSEAVSASVTGMTGVRPLVIEDIPFVFGNEYVLKEGAGDGYSGNYGAIALGGTGARTYEENLRYGYGGMLYVGDVVSTEPGNMSNVTRRAVNDLIAACNHSPSCTYLNFNRDCPRVIFIPVVDSLQVNGRDEATVVGFASFFLEGTRNSGGHTEVIGRFVRTVASGEIEVGQRDYGIRGVKLVR